MKFHVAEMCLLYHEFQGIVIGNRWLALLTREITTPGFIRRIIESITSGTYLNYNGIAPQSLKLIQFSDKFSFLLCSRESWFGWPVNITDGGNPCCTKFPFRGLGICLYSKE